MRRIHVLLPFFALALLSMPFLVQAGGMGAVKADLDVAEVYYIGPPENPLTRTRPVGPTVGQVIFSPTASEKMNITVQIKNGAPDTTFEIYAIPPGSWAPDGDRQEVTLNKKGKATVHLQVQIPEPGMFIKVSMMTADESIAYCTEHILDFAD